MNTLADQLTYRNKLFSLDWIFCSVKNGMFNYDNDLLYGIEWTEFNALYGHIGGRHVSQTGSK